MDYRDYINLELSNNEKLAFKIAFDKLDESLFDTDQVKYWMFIEATNSKHPKWPNTLFFKDRVTRETFKIGYDLLDTIQI
tara:strand:+ start:778 stop:1017 length:240 start_codon:yes stop_codon:yes gene_type:complete